MGKVNFVFGVNWGSVKTLYFSCCHDCVIEDWLGGWGGGGFIRIGFVLLWGESVVGLPVNN